MDAGAFKTAVVSVPGRARICRAPFGGMVIIHATAAETGGAFGMWETEVPPGQGPALHTHSRETEVFRVIRGTFRFQCGDDQFDAPEGTVVTLPIGVPHGWKNVGDGPGVIFGIVTPGGFEQMFVDIAETGARSEVNISAIEARFGIVNAATRRLGKHL